jgi:hypothetical protein
MCLGGKSCTSANCSSCSMTAGSESIMDDPLVPLPVALCEQVPVCYKSLPRLFHNVLILLTCITPQNATQLCILLCCPPRGPFWKSYQTNEWGGEAIAMKWINPFDLGKIIPIPCKNWQAHEQLWICLLALPLAEGIVLILHVVENLEKHILICKA